MATSTEAAMLELRCEELERAGQQVERQLRKFLAGALCARCGEQLGEDEQIEMTDDEETCHARCLRDDAADGNATTVLDTSNIIG
jgi:hypothetical protein